MMQNSHLGFCNEVLYLKQHDQLEPGGTWRVPSLIWMATPGMAVFTAMPCATLAILPGLRLHLPVLPQQKPGTAGVVIDRIPI
jgi:hypothetical protein